MLNSYKDKTIVFFGDSVTDTCKIFHKDHQYGAGYVSMLQTEFDVSYPDLNITVYNEGISGNKTEDLINRFDRDVKSKNPDLIFLLIGINDVWHLYDANIKPNITEIINRIDFIINKAHEIESKIVLLTPFLFPTDDYFKGLIPDFNNLIDAMHQYVQTKNVEFIDLYQIMKDSQSLAITKDSVHPTLYGHGIIAQAIINYLSK